MPATFSTATELPDVHTIDAVLALSIHEFLFFRQTCFSDAMNHGIRDRLPAIVGVFLRMPREPFVAFVKLSHINASDTVLPFSVLGLLLRSQPGIADMLNKVVCKMLEM